MATRLKQLHLQELSLVDEPANKASKVSLFKRDDSLVLLKAVAAMSDTSIDPDDDEGPKSFADLIAENEEQARRWEADDVLRPLFNAIQESLRSIAADGDMDSAAKADAMKLSIMQFLDAAVAAVPEVEQELVKALAKNPATAGFISAGKFKKSGDQPVRTGDKTMTDEKQKVADLEKKVADLTKAAMSKDDQIKEAQEELAEAKAKLAELTKSVEAGKTDEVIKVGDTEIRKSVVGESVFKAMAAQQTQIEKQRDDLEIKDLTKRAETEFANLPGEPVAKAKVLRAVTKMPEADRVTLEAMLKSGNEALKSSLTEIGKGGSGGGDEIDIEKSAKAYQVEHGIKTYGEAVNKYLETPEGRKAYAKSQGRKAA
jgi:hypothetical protein